MENPKYTYLDYAAIFFAISSLLGSVLFLAVVYCLETDRGSGGDAEQPAGRDVCTRAILRPLQQILPHYWKPRALL